MQKAQKALGVLRNMELSLEGYELRKAQGMIMIPIVREAIDSTKFYSKKGVR